MVLGPPLYFEDFLERDCKEEAFHAVLEPSSGSGPELAVLLCLSLVWFVLFTQWAACTSFLGLVT